MPEEIFYAISDISESLRLFRPKTSNWQTVLYGPDINIDLWRTRYDPETKILIEEVDTRSGWKIKAVQQDVKNFSQAVLQSALLANQLLQLPSSVQSDKLDLPY